MPLIWASLTTSHRLVEKPARRRWREKRDGSAEIKVERRKEGRRGREDGRGGEGFPQLVASILLRAEPRFIKRASKIKLRIDVASKHPAPACASLTLPPPPPPPPPPPSVHCPPLGCANEHRKLLYVQSILAAPNRLCSFHTPHHHPLLLHLPSVPPASE